MDESTKDSPCKKCVGTEEGQLRAEVDHLRQHLAERDGHLLALEAEFLKCTSRVHDLEEQVDTWREKYERLYDSHKRVQKLNQVLEDKLLQIVDKMKGEKNQLTKDIATLSVRLAESKYNYSMLQKENERYKNDMNLAIQLLQCKPDNFVAQKLDNLPVDTQARVSQYVMSKTSKPTSSTQSKNGNGNENETFDSSEYEFNISASLMTKILEDSIQDSMTKHCDSCTCTKSQAKPFCYNESYFSVGTQTVLTGEMKNSLCLNCNAEIKSTKSNLSIRSISPGDIRLLNDKNLGLTGPMYIIPQSEENFKAVVAPKVPENTMLNCDKVEANHVDFTKLEETKSDLHNSIHTKKDEETKMHKKNHALNMEPSVHHKLCDRTKTSMSSRLSSSLSMGNEEGVKNIMPITKENVIKSESLPRDNLSLRKNSQSSMGAISRTSSVAKSTVSTHKSGNHVGPGPRFCHLRMQAGSKNILLDNAEPDVPPVLYRRQSKCNENPIFKDLNDGMDNFIDLDKNEDEVKDDIKNDNVVAETTLIDVQVDNNLKGPETIVKNAPINPVLMNVSSSPLQPLKTHAFSNSSENNNNKSLSITSKQNVLEANDLLNDFTTEVSNVNNNNQTINDIPKTDVVTPTDNHDVKIFNFDRYEQNKLASQISRPLRKIDMAQLHSLENTRISKDFVPQHIPKLDKKDNATKSSLPAIVNVYPNLTQTHLKVNENKKVFTNEQSTSSLSSDDSAALFQKQQLLRVAEWVEQNLEQQNSYNDPLEDEMVYGNISSRRDSKLTRLTETLNELALNMPHPVSKYAKPYTREGHAWINKLAAQLKPNKPKQTTSDFKITNVTKETVFPVESEGATVTEDKAVNHDVNHFDAEEELRNFTNGDKEISAEDLARMEYNVKKFLLSGPQWVTSDTSRRSRRTSSKTETDV